MGDISNQEEEEYYTFVLYPRFGGRRPSTRTGNRKIRKVEISSYPMVQVLGETQTN